MQMQKIHKSEYSLAKQLWKNRYYFLLLAPAIIFFAMFCYVPMAGVVLAFKKFSYSAGIFGSEWIGFDHFKRLFESNSFYEILRNTLLISFYKLLFAFPMPIIFALLLNEIKSSKLKRTVQTVSYLPHFISWVVLGGIIVELLSPSRGVINYILQLFGAEPIYFLADPKYFRGVLIVSEIWKTMGWSSIIYLSSIAGVSAEQYESAKMDGANRFDMIIRITLPSIAPTIITMFILQLGGIMNAGFDQIFNLYNSSVYSVADIIDTYVYRVGIKDMAYDYTTAVGLFKNAVGFMLVIAANFVVKHIGEGENSIW